MRERAPPRRSTKESRSTRATDRRRRGPAVLLRGSARGGGLAARPFPRRAAGARRRASLPHAAQGADRGRTRSPSARGAVRDASRRLATGDELCARRAAAGASRAAGRRYSARHVVFEDAHLLVVDKPAGLVVHPAHGHETGTLVNALHRPLRRQPLRHRRRQEARHRASHRQGHDRACSSSPRPTRRTRGSRASSRITAARCIWCANISPSSGALPDRAAMASIAAPIGRHSTQRETMAVVPPERGREAITHWEMQQTSRRRRPRRLPAGDRPHASDSRAYGAYRPSAHRRRDLWRRLQDQDGAALARGPRRRRRPCAARRYTPRRSASRIR